MGVRFCENQGVWRDAMQCIVREKQRRAEKNRPKDAAHGKCPHILTSYRFSRRLGALLPTLDASEIADTGFGIRDAKYDDRDSEGCARSVKRDTSGATDEVNVKREGAHSRAVQRGTLTFHSSDQQEGVS